MILIERLAAHNFKQLREIDLTLPPSGRVLVEGLNEAGKSTLFEAVHFALYGRGLVTRGSGAGANESLIAYGADRATVEVTLRIDDRSLRVARTLRRGRTGDAVCAVGWADGRSGEVQQWRKVNDEVLAQLHGLDSDALLASCLVEQKKLGRLEELSRQKRQDVLLKLLDLDRLTRVKRRFDWGRIDDRALDLAERKLRLAEAAGRIEEMSRELADLERRIALTQIARCLSEADEHDRQAEALDGQIDLLSRRLAVARAEIARIETLDRTITRLEGLLDADQAATRAALQAAELERELARLDRVERETIPALQAERAALGIVGEHLGRLTELEDETADLRARQRRLEADPLDANLDANEEALDEGARAAVERLRRAAAVELLREWGRAAQEVESRQRGGALIAALDRAAEAAESEQLGAAALADRTTLAVGVSLAVTLAGVLGLALGPIAAPLILVGLGLLVWSWRRRSAAFREVARCALRAGDKRALAHDERVRQEAVRGKAPPDLAGLAERIRARGDRVPDSPEQAETLARALESGLPADWSLGALRNAARASCGQCLQERLGAVASERQAREREVAEHVATLYPEPGDLAGSGDVRPRVDGRSTLEGADRMGSAIGLLQNVAEGHRAVLLRVGQVDQQLKQARDQLRGRLEVERRLGAAREEAARHQARSRELTASLGGILGDAEVPREGAAAERQLAALRIARAPLDLEAAREESARLLSEQGELGARRQRASEDAAERRLAARELIVGLGIEPPPVVSWPALAPLLPELTSATVDPAARSRHLEGEREDLRDKRAAEEGVAADLEAELHLCRADLDPNACRVEARDLRRRKRVCERAVLVLDQVRENVLDAVLPNTLAYMRLLLPLLTAGRYHDAQLDQETYKIEVWDSQVRDFVEKDVFSGATQDQFSLALRLGFALAALPQERGVRPGFLFLDEPVAGFDGQRRDALLSLLSSGELVEYFPQVFFAVPTGVFDRNPLAYLVRLDQGRVIESTLP